LAKKNKFSADESSAPVDKENSAPNRSPIRSPVRKVMVVKSPHRNPAKATLELKFNCLKVPELKEELKQHGLSTVGKKAALVSRLLKAKMEEIEAQQQEQQQQQREPMSAFKRRPKVETSPKPNVVESAPIVVQPSQDNEVIDVDMMDESSSNSKPADSSKPAMQEEVADKMEPEEVVVLDEESSSDAPEDMSTTSVEKPTEDIAAVKLSPMKQASEKMLTHNEVMDPKEYWKSLKSTPGRNDLHSQQQQQPKEQVDDSAANQTRSPLRSVVKNAFKVFSNSPAPDIAQVPTIDSNDDDMTEDDISPPTSEVSTGSKITGAKVRELVSKISNSSGYQPAIAPSTSGGSASSLSKSVQAKKEARMAKMEEARKARLAEIRNKVRSSRTKEGCNSFDDHPLTYFPFHLQSKPVLTAKPVATPKEYTSTLSSLKATAASTTGKKKNLAAQMREKAAAAYRKEDAKTLMQSSSSEYDNPYASSVDVMQQQNTFGSAIKQASIKILQARSPLDTYEISDREESDTDDSDESDAENEKQKKKVSSILHIPCRHHESTKQ
jgi:hypothetical protein